MAVRVRFIYILIIILVSFGTIGQEGCEECFSPTNCEGTNPGQDEVNCDEGEHECNDACIPNEVDCCNRFSISGESFPCSFDEPICCDDVCLPLGVDCCFDSMGVLGVACNESKPFCCPGGSGTCASDFDSCPDVTECPEMTKPCGPGCISVIFTCCHEGSDTEFLSCPDFRPICCPIGTFPDCVNSPDECCDGTGCI